MFIFIVINSYGIVFVVSLTNIIIQPILHKFIEIDWQVGTWSYRMITGVTLTVDDDMQEYDLIISND